MAKTIADLGIETSTDWAKRIEEHQQTRITDVESRGVASQTSIASTEPSYLSQLAALVGTDQIGVTVALFNELPIKQKGELFSYQMIPSLGSPDKIEEIQIPKVKAMVQPLPEEAEKPLAWEVEREKREQEQEKTSLLHWFETYLRLNRDLVDIKGRLSEYHKG